MIANCLGIGIHTEQQSRVPSHSINTGYQARDVGKVPLYGGTIKHVSRGDCEIACGSECLH